MTDTEIREYAKHPYAVQPEHSKDRDWNKDWPTPHKEAPKRCMYCRSLTKQPEVYKPDHSQWRLWSYKLLQYLRASWIVRCTKCPTIHVWSYQNIYKAYVDPLENIQLGEQ